MAPQIYFQLVIRKWLEQRRQWSERGERAKTFHYKADTEEEDTSHWGAEETAQILSGNSGAEANKAIPDVYGIADSKTAILPACEGDSTEHQMGYVPDTSYSVGFTGGS